MDTLTMPPYFAPFAVGTLLVTASSVLLAADASETFLQGAERWGLWAACTLLLMGALLWGIYKIVSFVLNTLVRLIESTQEILTKVEDTIKNAPCGKYDWDSDEIIEEDTPTGGRQIRRVLKRRERREGA